MHGDPVVTKLMSTTDSSEWEHVDTLEVGFAADHPQGLLRVGEDGKPPLVGADLAAASLPDSCRPEPRISR